MDKYPVLQVIQNCIMISFSKSSMCLVLFASNQVEYFSFEQNLIIDPKQFPPWPDL